MTWQPNTASTTDTTLLFKGLEKLGKKAKAVEAIRLASARDPKSSLGVYTIDDADTPRTVSDTVALQCQLDAETLGGEQRYEILVSYQITKGVGKNRVVDEKMEVLGRLKFGKADEGGSAGAALKEVTQAFKSMSDAAEQMANADIKRIENIGKGVDILTGMLAAQSEATAQMTAVNANMVRMHELTLQDAREQRQEAREAADAAAAIAYEERRDQRTMGMLSTIGVMVKEVLDKSLPTLLFKIQVDTMAKAKAEGFSVEQPPTPSASPEPTPDPNPNVTITQESALAQELVSIFEQLSPKDRAEFKETAGEDVWSLFLAAMSAETDDEARGRLLRLPKAVNEIGEKKIHLLAILNRLGPIYAMKLQALFDRIGVKFTG